MAGASDKRAPRRPKPRSKARGAAPSLEDDFGPGAASAESAASDRPEPPPSGPIPGLACAGERCLFKPLADLVARFSLRLTRGHGGSLSRAALSGIELMRALRDFLDEEIAFAERAAGREPRQGPRVVKIPVE